MPVKRYPPIRARQDVKIVWRMTGSGPLEVSITAPDGTRQRPEWGPEPHGGSSYDRPGDEWGVGYRFSVPGCWHLGLRRGEASGDVWLLVR